MIDELEEAVQCFERWSRTRVVFYFFDSRLASIFSRNRCQHSDNYCHMVKVAGCERQCQQFDYYRLLANAWKYRNGGVKLCRAGVWEWVHTIYHGDELLGALLAGIRRADPDAALNYPVYRSKEPPYKLAFTPEESGVLPLDAAGGEDRWVLEGLRQLAARLQLYCARYCADGFNDNKLPRPEKLRLLIERMYRRDLSIDRLAREFNLSPSRMYHFIKESTGKSLNDLLNEQRLAEARNLLENSNFLVKQISEYCNFSSPAYFHRLFKAASGITPEEYRKSRRSPENHS